MKYAFLLISLICLNLYPSNEQAVSTVRVIDNTNETLTGVKVKLEGTNYVFYTDLKGECHIPTAMLKHCASVSFSVVSYKPVTCKAGQLKNTIILEMR